MSLGTDDRRGKVWRRSIGQVNPPPHPDDLHSNRRPPWHGGLFHWWLWHISLHLNRSSAVGSGGGRGLVWLMPSPVVNQNKFAVNGQKNNPPDLVTNPFRVACYEDIINIPHDILGRKIAGDTKLWPLSTRSTCIRTFAQDFLRVIQSKTQG